MYHGRADFGQEGERVKEGAEMNAIIVTGADAKEIADLVLAVQDRQDTSPKMKTPESERESMILQYERRLKRLKAGASPGDVIF